MQKVLKGDKVKVLLGKDRGKEANVERVSMKKGKVWLPQINVYKRHMRKNAALNFEGGVVDITKPLDISNVALICPNCNKVTRVGFEATKDGKKIRICRKCKKEIK